MILFFFFFQAEDGIRDRSPSRGLGDVYKRQAYYSLVCSRLTKDPAEKMEWYQKVQHGLQNTLGMCCLIAGYYEQAEYDAIHRMENRFVTAALEEGNVYALADYYFMNGSAYACVDMAVSYTHLTLPTKRIGEISVVAVSLKKKRENK